MIVDLFVVFLEFVVVLVLVVVIVVHVAFREFLTFDISHFQPLFRTLSSFLVLVVAVDPTHDLFRLAKHVVVVVVVVLSCTLVVGRRLCPSLASTVVFPSRRVAVVSVRDYEFLLAVLGSASSFEVEFEVVGISTRDDLGCVRRRVPSAFTGEGCSRTITGNNESSE
jgi:hypothetical protein